MPASPDSHSTMSAGSARCFGRFRHSVAGNFSIAFAAATPLLLLAAGTAIDYALYANLTSRAQVTADAAARKGIEQGLQKVDVYVKGPGSGRETAIRSLQAAGLEVMSVRDVTPQAHNGCRPRKRRRV